MDVRAIEVGEPQREHEIERPGYPQEKPVTRPVELPNPAESPLVPEKVPAGPSR